MQGIGLRRSTGDRPSIDDRFRKVGRWKFREQNFGGPREDRMPPTRPNIHQGLQNETAEMSAWVRQNRGCCAPQVIHGDQVEVEGPRRIRERSGAARRVFQFVQHGQEPLRAVVGHGFPFEPCHPVDERGRTGQGWIGDRPVPARQLRQPPPRHPAEGGGGFSADLHRGTAIGRRQVGPDRNESRIFPLAY